ncbi:MAG: DUF1549 domain-containing protein [Planctomycetales bacterium]|nr:DUF1549 domain-containing protein [Planctomycetales bacterium]
MSTQSPHPTLRTPVAALLVGAFVSSIGYAQAPPSSPAQPAQRLDPVSVRYAGETDEVPDFQQHVVPLLGTLGCSGRSCHGSFQGRGGFRLSLFGYDFKMDHEALTAKASSSGRRVDRAAPDDSLIIAKPTMRESHEGGERFAAGSWQHRMLARWIAAGAEGVREPRTLQRLEIEPAEVLLAARPATAEGTSGDAARPVPLRVMAIWADGSREDVTPLCRFRTNDDTLVTVDAAGRLLPVTPPPGQPVSAGDTHVIAFYDNGVAAVPVIRSAFAVSTAAQPESFANPIDKFVEAKLGKLGITPSALCSDTEFLRRVSIDLTGTLPTPGEVTEFLADSAADKRERKVEELLQRPAYAAWWANRICDYTGCNPAQQAELGQETSVQWYMWVHQRLLENLPYDQLVSRIVKATGRAEGQSYADYAREMTSYYLDESADRFSHRATMPHYWTRRSVEKADDKAEAFAHNFLGIRLQCAQCHKHPFAPWTQEDYRHFSALLDNVRFGVPDDARSEYDSMAKRVGLSGSNRNGLPVRNETLRRASDDVAIPWRELYLAKREQPARLKLLRSREVELAGADDPRDAVLTWMLEPGNPYFARSFVNRVWAAYFHRGLIDPPDDLNPANPPSHPQLLDWLATEFVQRNYDMKWLHRQIVTSDAYQRSWRPNDTNREDRRNLSRAIPRRLPAEAVYDCVKQAVAGDGQLEEVRTDLTRRASGHLSMRLAGTYAMDVFGKPARAANCDCERANQPTLLQAVFLHNDPLIEQRLLESGWVAELEQAAAKGERSNEAELVRAAWLRALSRPPTDDELQRGVRHLRQAPELGAGMRDLLWALINTKEFILN